MKTLCMATLIVPSHWAQGGHMARAKGFDPWAWGTVAPIRSKIWSLPWIATHGLQSRAIQVKEGITFCCGLKSGNPETSLRNCSASSFSSSSCPSLSSACPRPSPLSWTPFRWTFRASFQEWNSMLYKCHIFMAIPKWSDRMFCDFLHNLLEQNTGWPFRKFQTSHWHHDKSCILVLGAYIVTQHYF